MTDAGAALKKVIAAKANFVVHSSLGAQEVLRGILTDGELELNEDVTKILLDDHQRRVLGIAAEANAYTMIGRIPFLSGKIPNSGMSAMVAGDERLKRPFIVAIANPAKIAGARVGVARKLAAFLRSPETQAWIAEFGKGKYDDRPLFFPVVVSH
jgi:ABC-type tungstate transport system permease subunit